MNGVGKSSNPVEVGLYLKVSESLMGVRLRPASDPCTHFGSGYVETAFACREAHERPG